MIQKVGKIVDVLKKWGGGGTQPQLVELGGNWPSSPLGFWWRGIPHSPGRPWEKNKVIYQTGVDTTVNGCCVDRIQPIVIIVRVASFRN